MAVFIQYFWNFFVSSSLQLENKMFIFLKVKVCFFKIEVPGGQFLRHFKNREWKYFWIFLDPFRLFWVLKIIKMLYFRYDFFFFHNWGLREGYYFDILMVKQEVRICIILNSLFLNIIKIFCIFFIFLNWKKYFSNTEGRKGGFCKILKAINENI